MNSRTISPNLRLLTLSLRTICEKLCFCSFVTWGDGKLSICKKQKEIFLNHIQKHNKIEVILEKNPKWRQIHLYKGVHPLPQVVKVFLVEGEDDIDVVVDRRGRRSCRRGCATEQPHYVHEEGFAVMVDDGRQGCPLTRNVYEMAEKKWKLF